VARPLVAFPRPLTSVLDGDRLLTLRPLVHCQGIRLLIQEKPVNPINRPLQAPSALFGRRGSLKQSRACSVPYSAHMPMLALTLRCSDRIGPISGPNRTFSTESMKYEFVLTFSKCMILRFDSCFSKCMSRHFVLTFHFSTISASGVTSTIFDSDSRNCCNVARTACNSSVLALPIWAGLTGL
jgi:hypothetical protein